MKQVKRYLVLLLLVLSCTPASTEVTVISNPIARKDNGVFLEQNIVKVFTLRSRYWVNGERLQVYILPKESIYTKVFAKKFLHMTAQEYFDIIEANQASGRGPVPVILRSQSDLVLKVLNTKGSVGYADESILVNVGNRLHVIR